LLEIYSHAKPSQDKIAIALGVSIEELLK